MLSGSNDRAAAFADRLLEAEMKRAPVAPIADEVGPGDVAFAYQIQEHNTLRAVGAGRRLVGRKIGLTSPAVQRQLGVDQPDFGMLFADMALADGALVPAGKLIHPKVEAEIAFVMKSSVNRADCTITELMGAIDYCVPAMEIVDSRIVDWKISIVDTVADNASSGMFVLGMSRKSIDEVDLRLCGMVLEQNGAAVSFGTGAACLGHPLNAALWLARQMAARGRPLDCGDIVLSGALGPMVAARPGDRFEAHIGGLGTVHVGFEA